MLVIRPVENRDVDGLLKLAELTGFGLTTLPRDREIITRRVKGSVRGFARMDEEHPHGEAYLFVLEDLHTGGIVGTSGVVSKVGGFEPFYAYRIETKVAQSEALKVRKEVGALHLVTEHNGPSEIGSLFLHPDYRKEGNGRLLSLVRFLFMAQRPRLFDPVVIAEMRGVVDAQGVSPFWDALGRHFFDCDYPQADLMSMVSKQFIAQLMPTHPIYIPLLPPAAQAVIGKVHDETAPALRILEDEGFSFSGMVDIFDAGPLIRCEVANVRAVRESRTAAVEEIVEREVEGPAQVICTTGPEFRATKGAAEVMPGGGVRLRSNVALALNVRVGEAVRFVGMKAKA